MKLYYSAGACSMAPHILATEAGLTMKTEAVDMKTKKTAAGADYTKVSPLGYVPAIETDDGTVLTEVATLLQFIAEKSPAKNLMPTTGQERWRAMQWLNFISTELHKGFSPLFNPAFNAETKKVATDRLMTRFDYVEKQLTEKGPFLMGSTFTAPDAYLFTVMGWTKPNKIDMSKWPKIMGYMETVMMRPSVQTVMKAEGLLK